MSSGPFVLSLKNRQTGLYIREIVYSNRGIARMYTEPPGRILVSETKTKKPGARRRNRPSPRHRLLASATALFSTEGIRVIGIDRILREADVAKASLYSLFGSKDALAIAYLSEQDRLWREHYAERTAEMTDPAEKILAFFDQCIEEEPAKDYRGSLFQNAANEYPRPETEGERGIVAAVREHRQWCMDTLIGLLEQKNGYPGATQAQQLMVFIDGGLAGCRLNRSLDSLYTARELAAQLLAAPPADYAI